MPLNLVFLQGRKKLRRHLLFRHLARNFASARSRSRIVEPTFILDEPERTVKILDLLKDLLTTSMHQCASVLDGFIAQFAQTKETLDGSIKAGNNQERTNTLTEQVAILEGYLPEQVEGEALMALIDEVVVETGATTKKDMGRVMGTLTQRTGGNFDKAAAAATLNQRLS